MSGPCTAEIHRWLTGRVAAILGLDTGAVDAFQPLAHHGLSSRHLLELVGDLETWLGRRLSPTLVYQHATIASLAACLAEEGSGSVASPAPAGPATEREPLAVIGMGCRFPGAADPRQLWGLLRDGRDAVAPVPPERWRLWAAAGLDDGEQWPQAMRRGGLLVEVDGFDAGFFGISPREAASLDPQQRLLLEVAWEALEDAGQVPARLAGTAAGVFIGISGSDYARLQPGGAGLADAYSGTGTAPSLAANRLSYLLDLRGPSLAVDTACSSSLVAVHLACRSLRSGECRLALAGGVNLILAPYLTLALAQAGMLAPGGRCLTFDARAEGYVRSEGAGVVVLKRLSDAVADGDRILALVRGTAVAQDGRSNGLTAPNGLAQRALLAAALADAGVAPACIGLVEAHGTGTPLGDPVEMEALKAVLLAGRAPQQTCFVGSVKTNIGHLEAAAGIAGLIKAVLALRHGEIPPHLHLEEPNPLLGLDGTPFEIPRRPRPWPAGSLPRLAGVSSFGFGGTIAHAVLEEAPQDAASGGEPGPETGLLVLSARSPNALRELADRYRGFLQQQGAGSLADICFTAACGRTHHEHRLAAVGAGGFQAQLAACVEGRPAPGLHVGRAARGASPGVVFLFTGQGALLAGAGRELYDSQPVFRAALELCDELLRRHRDHGVTDLLFGPAGGPRLADTFQTQPALFALEYAVAELWRSWGVRPAVVLGHSLGEYVAACVAGVLELSDAIRLVAERARLMQELCAPGRMVSVFACAERVDAALAGTEAALAAVNGPSNVVVAGRAEAVERALRLISGAACRPIGVDRAFHTSLIEPMLGPFARMLETVRFGPPRIALVSSLTGALLPAGYVPGPEHWLRHTRETVRFADCVGAIAAEGHRIFLEAGPGTGLLALVRQHPACGPGGLFVPSLRPGRPEAQTLLDSLGELYVHGVDVNWSGVHRGRRGRIVSLPTYPFERRRHWWGGAAGSSEGADAAPEPAGGGLTRHELLAAGDEERHALLVSHLRGEAARVLATSVEELEIDRPLPELGLDSLMAVELAHRLGSALGLAVPAVRLLDAVSTAALADLLLQRLDAPGELLPAAAAAGEGPLSSGQQALWTLQRLDPASAAYNVFFALRVRSAVDPEALRRALQALVDRHPALRTVYAVRAGLPLQRVSTGLSVGFESLDATAWSGERLDAHLADAAHRPFDLQQGPLLRAVLYRRAAAEHVLLLTAHHIAVDGWSFAVLFDELGALYPAEREGRPAALPPLELGYLDFVRWQEERLAGPAGERLWEHWRDRLAGAEPLELEPDRPAGGSRREGGICAFTVEAGLTARLKALARSSGTTLFTALLALFQVALHRTCGQEDIVVGSPVANRPWPGLEGTVGYFVNLVVLRADLRGDPAFSDVLVQARGTVLAALEHGEFPFPLLVERLARHRPRDPGRPPLVRAVFVLHKPHRLGREGLPALLAGGGGGRMELGGLALESMPLEPREVRFDLELSVVETGGGISGCLLYDRGFWREETAAALIDRLTALMTSAAADPERRLSQMLDPVPRRDGGAGPPGRLHTLFELQAARTPEAEAVCGPTLARGAAGAPVWERLTYRELDRRAGRVARRLRALGQGAESVVGVCLERSVDAVVAILGVLKAGAAYLPLDPAYPAARLAAMVRDAGVSAVLGEPGLAGRAPELADTLVDLTAGGEPEGVEEREGAGADPLHPAYVIYTSGSTGEPKGVVIPHANVVRLLDQTRGAFGFGPGDTWTLFHSCAFDFSVWELWGALLTGGRLVVVPFDLSRSPDLFLDLLRGERVTVLNQTPSAFRALAEAAARRPGALGSALRWVILGGEAVDLPALTSWLERQDAPPVVNMYGITETTVHVTHRPLSAGDLAGGAASPIGVPIADLHVHLLDEGLQPVADGEAGEICVAGPGLARGYLGRPAQTAERFLPNPFSGIRGDRLYRSGDLARRLAGGGLEFLGRADRQVKIRGHRVELGEVESALRRHPGIREAVVMARGDGPWQGARLVGYIVPHPGWAPTPAALRGYLQSVLPEPMVCSAWVVLEALPVNLNGKVDLCSLPAPSRARPDLPLPPVSPRTPAEAAMVEIWAEVLDLEEVGIDDDFFALGGDSILGLRVQVLAEGRGLGFAGHELFRHPTVRGLVAAAQADGGDVGREVDPVPPGQPFAGLGGADRRRLPPDIEDAFPLAQLQTGMLYHADLDPRRALYQSVSSFDLAAPWDAAALRATARRLASGHPALRTSFDLEGPGEPLQLVHREVEIPLDLYDLSGLDEAEQRRTLAEWLEAERRRRFDRRRPPLLRLAVHRRGDYRLQVTLTDHHAILDGWSVATLLSELLLTYAACLAGVDYVPEPAATSFRDFVAAERAAAGSEACREHWRRELDGCTPSPLPVWPAAPPAEAGAATLAVSIAPGLCAELVALAQTLAVPLKSVLLAAHLRVVSLLAGRPDVTVGLVTNGRLPRPGGERVLGLFLNTVPLRLRIEDGSWTGLIRGVVEAERRLLPFRRYPLAEMQRLLGGGRPLFDTAFNFVHFHAYERALRLTGFRLREATYLQETNLPLVVHAEMRAGQAWLALEWDTAVFPAAQVQAMAGYYAAVLAAMTADPGGSCALHLPLSAAERQQLLVEWGGGAEVPATEPLHRLFEAQARRTPGAEAVTVPAEPGRAAVRWTYAELNRRANRLAHRLRALGVGPESVVGLCARRSAELVAALLAVLKAGGAYLPLDPTYPEERLAFMVEDSGVRILLVEPEIAAELPPLGTAVVLLEEDGEQGAAEDLHGRLDPRHPAYVLYTSGSTGRPKGVVVSHANVARLFEAARCGVDFRAEDVWTLCHSYAFDFSVWEIWGALLFGARLVVVSHWVSRSGEDLLDLICREGVTVLNQTPSAFRSLLEAAVRPGAPEPRLRQIVFGGERLDPALLAPWLALFGDRGPRLVNMYGITETTVHVTWRHLTTADGGATGSRIGRPLPDLRLHVLDRHLMPVPIGVAGEIHVGGAGLARGYLGRLALTAERFVPDPFSRRGGERLYRSGDLARYLPDGDLEYLGRTDHQVKVRGHRIETGEVEAALESHPGIRQAAVVARPERPGGGEARLVAYVVPAGERAPDATVLRQHLRRTLPDSMLCSAFVELPALPLTPSGKIDRSALPEPGRQRPALLREPAAPATPLEEELAALWAEVLGIERIGVHDSFLDLGGHSQLAIRVVARVRARYGVDLPLRTFFEIPTIAELALWILERQLEQTDPAESLRLLEQLEAPPPASPVPLRSSVDGF